MRIKECLLHILNYPFTTSIIYSTLLYSSIHIKGIPRFHSPLREKILPNVVALRSDAECNLSMAKDDRINYSVRNTFTPDMNVNS